MSSLMMEAVRTSETSVDNYFTRQYIPEDNSEHNNLESFDFHFCDFSVSSTGDSARIKTIISFQIFDSICMPTDLQAFLGMCAFEAGGGGRRLP
jgi:hypothetical protein